MDSRRVFEFIRGYIRPEDKLLEDLREECERDGVPLIRPETEAFLAAAKMAFSIFSSIWLHTSVKVWVSGRDSRRNQASVLAKWWRQWRAFSQGKSQSTCITKKLSTNRWLQAIVQAISRQVPHPLQGLWLIPIFMGTMPYWTIFRF